MVGVRLGQREFLGHRLHVHVDGQVVGGGEVRHQQHELVVGRRVQVGMVHAKCEVLQGQLAEAQHPQFRKIEGPGFELGP